MTTSRSTHRPAPDGSDYAFAPLVSMMAFLALLAGCGTHLITAGVELSREELRALVLITSGCTCLAMMLLTQLFASLSAWWFWVRDDR